MYRVVKWGGLIAAAVALAAVAAMTSGCASTALGEDPLLVRTEQGIKAGLEIADTFLRIEDAHAEELARVAPWAGSIAQQIRVNGPGLCRTAWAAVESYSAATDALEAARAAADATDLAAAENRRAERREAMLIAAEKFGALVEQARVAISAWAGKGGGS